MSAKNVAKGIAKLSLLAAIIVSAVPTAAFSAGAAITKEEWAALMQDAEFKEADKELNEAYRQAAAALPEADRAGLLKEQRAWAAKRERDAAAKFAKGTPEYARFLISEARGRVAALNPPASASSGAYGGVYAFGGDVDGGPSGRVIVYPVSSGVALFFLDVSRGAPSYNSGQLFGEMALSGSVGTYKSVDVSSGFNCALKFKFAQKLLVISTEDGRGECDFGGNVSADNTYKLTGEPIPKGYAVGDNEYLFEDEAKRIRSKK